MYAPRTSYNNSFSKEAFFNDHDLPNFGNEYETSELSNSTSLSETKYLSDFQMTHQYSNGNRVETLADMQHRRERNSAQNKFKAKRRLLTETMKRRREIESLLKEDKLRRPRARTKKFKRALAEEDTKINFLREGVKLKVERMQAEDGNPLDGVLFQCTVKVLLFIVLLTFSLLSLMGTVISLTLLML